jgi:hypothetical protein
MAPVNALQQLTGLLAHGTWVNPSKPLRGRLQEAVERLECFERLII